MKKILIVEDDRLAAELERDYLEAAGYEALICDNGTEGKNLALKGEYSLIILDVMLPGENGFNICREIRKAMNIPIIMVTAKKEDVDKIRGLGLGADDYVTKPFSPSELVARVNAHIRIHERLLNAENEEFAQDDIIEVNELKIIVPYRRVIVRGEYVELKNKEFELLLFLASNPNIVFSKDEIFNKIWGMDSIGNAATVTVHINRIREKIEKDASNPQYIQTVWGTGYRFSDSSQRSENL